MRGRKPLPTNLKVLKGTLRKDRLLNEPQPEICIPDPPSVLDEIALEEWHSISVLLYEQGLLTELDRAMLAGYCTTFSRWVKAEAALKKSAMLIKTSKNSLVQNPLISISNKSMELMHMFLSEFGMSPSSRTRINVLTKAKSSRFKILDEM